MNLPQRRTGVSPLHMLRGAAGVLLWAVALVTAGCASTADRNPQLQQDGVFAYPATARAAHTEGTVRVRFDIGVDGRVRNAQVESAQPPGVFDVAALAYVQGRRYLPARKAGQVVPVLGTTAQIRFQLGEAADYP